MQARKCWIFDTSRYLAYLPSFQAFSYCNHDTSSTLGRSIEQISVPSTPARHLFDSYICWSLKLDTCYLSRFKKETKILICFLGIRECVFGTSFLLTLDIYKAYFRGCHIREYKKNICKRWPMPYSLWKKLLRLYALGFCNQVLLDLHCWWSEELCSQDLL